MFVGAGKQKSEIPAEKVLVSFFRLAWREPKSEAKFLVKPEVSSLESANFHHFGRLIFVPWSVGALRASAFPPTTREKGKNKSDIHRFTSQLKGFLSAQVRAEARR